MDFKSVSLIVLCAVQIVNAEPEWRGFKKFSDVAIPAPIQKVSKSVFRIYFPTAPTKIVDLSDPSKLDAIVAEYTGKNWEMIQLAYCRVQDISKCPISPIENMGGGSAFVVNDKKTIATNLHNLQPWISAVAANNGWKPEEFKEKLGEIVVPFILTDQNGDAVFSPSDALSTGEAYRIKLINAEPKLFSPAINIRQMLFALSDYVELEFKNEFKVPALPLAASSEADSYFVVGFPGPTNLFAKRGLGDGDGKHQMISTGEKTAQELSSGPGTAMAQLKYFTRITAPSYTGNSGGPVVNAKGEVVGILSSGDLAREIDGKPAYYSEFINIIKKDALQNLWKTGQP